MATEKRETIYEHAREAEPQQSSSAVPSDRELFVGDIKEQLSEREVFAGEEDFYKSLADSIHAAPAPSRRTGTDASQPTTLTHQPGQGWRKHFSNLQKILAVSIVLIWAMVLYALLKSPSAPAAARALAPAVQQTPSPKPPVPDTTRQVPQQLQKPEPVPPPVQPLSLKVAQNFYLQKDYNKAYAAYDQLRQSLPADAEGQLLRDFLHLRMALCAKKAADRAGQITPPLSADQLNRLFRTLSESPSPVVSVLASYHRSFLELQKKQYLKARTRAYQAIALISAVDWATSRDELQNQNAFERDWALSLQRDCYFLVAECLTRDVLSLSDADKDLPVDLWRYPGELPDPLRNIDEAQLLSFLNSGSEKLSKALLGPKIQKLSHQHANRWSVICHGASVEEILARFSVSAGLDISWGFPNTQALQEEEDTLRDHILQVAEKWYPRKRPVTLYMPAATTQQFVTAAAGCVGLLARMEDSKTINVFNPAEYSSLSEHLSLLTQQAISLWQRFLLTFHDDERIPNAHFALGLLQSQKDRVIDAVAEYKLVANRFSKTSLAPFALLHSSRLKTNIHDYFGARQDLKQLVEQYPDAEISGRAYLYLADATMNAKLYDDAERLYRKVYNLALSLESQTAAALGAGRCFYEKKDHQGAAKWLTRYISLATDRTSRDLYLAYLLLAKTNLALGKHRQAADAFQYALKGRLSTEQYVETVSALVEAQIQQEHFVQALDILENLRARHLSQKQSIQILLLRSKTLRAMGLVDKAIAVLADMAQYLSDTRLKARVSFELTKCYIAKGDFSRAQRSSTESLALVEPGPFAHEIALELANVCLKLGQNYQTISICSQLLDSGPADSIKQKTLYLLATAYSRQKNYDSATLALLDRYNQIGQLTDN